MTLSVHLVPKGTPPVLIPFMVIIERVRLYIRPVTLSVRLIVNIIAGHLLLGLMRDAASSDNMSYIAAIIILSFQCILVLLELFVSYIQSYVFMLLAGLYRSELN